MVALLVHAVYAYPGFMSFDSIDQLRQARAGWYNDWHPPAMAALWHVVDAIVPGPLGMYAIQTSCFLVGITLILRGARVRLVPAAIAAGLLLWFPPIGTTMAVIWKDSQMVGYLALGTALLIRPSRRSQLGGVALMLLASAMRHNAFTMTLPIVVMLFRWSPDHARLRRYAIAAGAWLAITLAAVGINAALTDEHAYPWHDSVAMFDIVGTIDFAPPLSDAELRADLDGVPVLVDADLQKRARAAYSPIDSWYKVLETHFMRWPRTDDERDAVARAWTRLATEHPGAYLQHRWHAFFHVLGLQHGPHQGVWVGISGSAKDLVDYEPSDVQAWLERHAAALGTSWLFRAWVYLALVILLVPLAVRARDRLAICLAASALVSEAALFFITPTPDFRYSIWLVPCAFVIALVLVAPRSRRLGAL